MQLAIPILCILRYIYSTYNACIHTLPHMFSLSLFISNPGCHIIVSTLMLLKLCFFGLTIHKQLKKLDFVLQ